jgi:hypothetical protein
MPDRSSTASAVTAHASQDRDTGEERAELTGAAVADGRADGLTVIPVRLEGAHDCLGVTSGQRGLIAADDITGMGGPGLEDGRPQVALSVDRLWLK